MTTTLPNPRDLTQPWPSDAPKDRLWMAVAQEKERWEMLVHDATQANDIVHRLFLLTRASTPFAFVTSWDFTTTSDLAVARFQRGEDIETILNDLWRYGYVVSHMVKTL